MASRLSRGASWLLAPLFAVLSPSLTTTFAAEHRFLITNSEDVPLADAPVIVTTFQEAYVPGTFRVETRTNRRGEAVIVLDARQEAAPSIDCYAFKDGHRYSRRSIAAEDRQGPVIHHRVRLEACEPEVVARILNPDGTPARDAAVVRWSEFTREYGNPNGKGITPQGIPARLDSVEPTQADSEGVITIQHANHFSWAIGPDGSGWLAWTVPDWLVYSPDGAAPLPGGVSRPTIRLKPWASLRGRIAIRQLPAEAEPTRSLDDCQLHLSAIYVFPDEEKPTPRQLLVTYLAEVDSEGRFAFPQLLAGYATLDLMSGFDLIAQRGVHLEGNVTFDWDMSDRRLPDDWTVERRVRHAAFDRLPEHEAVVRVVNDQGQPIPNVGVRCILPLEPGPTYNMPHAHLDCPPLPQSRYPHMETDERGEARFRFKGTALAVWSLYNTAYQFRQGRMLHAHDVTKLDGPIIVTAQRNVTVGGIVVDQQGRPVPSTGIRLQFTLPGSDELVSRFDDSARTDDQGRWEFQRLPEPATVRRIEFENYYPTLEQMEASYQEALKRFEAAQKPSADGTSQTGFPHPYGEPVKPEPITPERAALSRRCENLAPVTVLDPSSEELRQGTLRTVLPIGATLTLNNAYPEPKPDGRRRPSREIRPRIAVWSGNAASPDGRTLREDKGYARDQHVIPRDDGSCVVRRLRPGRADVFVSMPANSVMQGIPEVFYRQITLAPGAAENTLDLEFQSPDTHGLVRIVDWETRRPIEGAVVSPMAPLPCVVPQTHWTWGCWHGLSGPDGIARVKAPDGVEADYTVTHPDYRPTEFGYRRESAGQLIRLERPQAADQ